MDANHCPGAVQLLFRLPRGQRYVHCGDFRFHARMLADARLAAFQRAAALYLDTTYCQPSFCFPLQARCPLHGNMCTPQYRKLKP